MTLDEQLEQLAHLSYPRQVDVVDKVMSTLSNRNLHPSKSIHPLWSRVAVVAAAVVALVLVVNITLPYFRTYNEADMGNMMAQLNDYASWNTIEESAENPYEFLYE